MEETAKKRPRLPPSLKDVVYIAVISSPRSGRKSNFEVTAVSMSDFSIIKLNYSRKTRLAPGTVVDLRDFGEMSHYTIEDGVPFESLDKRNLSTVGKALAAAGGINPIGLIKARTMPEEGIKNLFLLLNMDDENALRKLSGEIKTSCTKEKVSHGDLFPYFIKAFSGVKNPPDIRQQEAFVSICGDDPQVMTELIEGYLESFGVGEDS